MTIKSLLGLRILTEPIKQEVDTTETGIILVAATKPNKGKVFMVGGEVNHYLKEKGIEPLNVGDIIIYEKNDYAELNSDGKDYQLITIHPVIAVV